jgi:hypothetical protein
MGTAIAPARRASMAQWMAHHFISGPDLDHPFWLCDSHFGTLLLAWPVGEA